jgi:hypothetical protein
LRDRADPPMWREVARCADAQSEVVVDTYVHYLRRKQGKKVVSTA